MNILNKEELHAPSSRAYYKLSQVFDDYFQTNTFYSLPPTTDAASIDLGSSPGGWTQVLHTRAKLSKVLSIDPGILARRVENLPGVKHCRYDFTSQSAQEDMISCIPFSHVVCDASTNASEVFPKIISTFDEVHEKINKGKEEKMLLTLPLSMVVTIKMPYKTVRSRNRILKEMGDQLPARLISMMKWSGSNEAMYKVVHLMANSENERSVIILFR